MRKHLVVRALFTGLVLLLLYYILFVETNEYMKVWFALLWGVIAITAVFRMEWQSWWEPATLDLHPALQFLLASILILATIVATDWTSLGERDFNQAVYVFWTLTLFRKGFRWAYLRLKGEAD